jgi:hypothetical protein
MHLSVAPDMETMGIIGTEHEILNTSLIAHLNIVIRIFSIHPKYWISFKKKKTNSSVLHYVLP